MRHSTIRAGFLLAVIVAFFSDNACADKIWVAPQELSEKQKAVQAQWHPRAIETISGKIVQFDAKQLRVRVSGETSDTLIASHRVLWIEADDLFAKESEALQLFSEGKYAQSVRPFIDALASRPPVWRQEWFSMMAATAARMGGQHKIALELVSQLDARPLPPLAVAWLPVDWDGKTRIRNRAVIESAKERLADPSAAVRLVAASWLLSTTDRNIAEPVLRRLSADSQRPIVARLATIVAFRAASPPEVIEGADVWQKKVDALPMVLQSGPTSTLVEKFQRAGLTSRAKKLQLSLELTPVIPNLAAAND